MKYEGIIGFIIGVIIGVALAMFIINKRSISYRNIEEWEMKELPDGTLKVIVHRMVKEE